MCVSEEAFDPAATSEPKKVNKPEEDEQGPKNEVNSLDPNSGTDSLVPPDDLELLKLDEPSWDDFLSKNEEKEITTKKKRKIDNQDPYDLLMGDAPYNSHQYNHGYNPVDDFLANWDKRGNGRDRDNNRLGGRRRNKGRQRNKQRDEAELADALPPNPTQGMPVYPYGAGDAKEEYSNNLVSETVRPPIKHHSCAALRCHAGGRCVADTLRGGVRCQCRLGNAGEFCEQGNPFL